MDSTVADLEHAYLIKNALNDDILRLIEKHDIDGYPTGNPVMDRKYIAFAHAVRALNNPAQVEPSDSNNDPVFSLLDKYAPTDEEKIASARALLKGTNNG